MKRTCGISGHQLGGGETDQESIPGEIGHRLKIIVKRRERQKKALKKKNTLLKRGAYKKEGRPSRSSFRENTDHRGDA